MVTTASLPLDHSDSRNRHITGTTGCFGAAAAAAKAMNLSSKQFAAALGHAASMAGGLRAAFGTDTKTLHMGRGAQNGLLAAELALHEFGSFPKAIEQWANRVSSTVTPSCLSELADHATWQILQNTFKPYPCGIVIHPLIDGCLEAFHDFLSMQPRDGPLHESLESVKVIVNPQCVRLCSIRHPQSGLETIFSLYHGCAVALVHGQAGPAEFSDAVACDDQVVASVRDKIAVETDSKVNDDEAYITLKLRTEGTQMLEEKKYHIEHATGSLSRPMSKSQLEDKFLDQSTQSLGTSKAHEAIKACWRLESLKDVAELAQLLVP